MPKAVPALEVSTEPAALPVRKRGGKPVALEEHTVVTKWAEEKKIDNKPKPAARKAVTREPEVEDEGEEIDEIYSDLPDDLAVFLQNNSGQREVTMEVREIPGPRTDVSPGIRAGIYHANHRFDVNTHQDDLALHYAKPDTPTRFMLRLKCGGQYVPNGTIFPVDVIGASVERKLAAGVKVDLPAPAAAVSHTPPAPIQQEAPDPLAGINQTLALLEKFQAIGLIPKLERQRQEPVIVQPNPQPQFTEEDHIIRAAMASPDAQERVAKGIFSKLMGGAMAADEAPWYADLIKEFAVSLAPGINALMQAGAHQMVQARAVVAQPNGAPPSLPEGAQSIAPQQTPAHFPLEVTPTPIAQSEPQQPAPNAPTKFQLYAAAFATILEVRQLPPPLNQPHKAARALLELVRLNSVQVGEDEFVSPFDDVVDDFIAGEPGEILSLAETFAPHASETIKAPDAPQWLNAVQDEIRKEWAQDANDQS